MVFSDFYEVAQKSPTFCRRNKTYSVFARRHGCLLPFFVLCRYKFIITYPVALCQGAELFSNILVYKQCTKTEFIKNLTTRKGIFRSQNYYHRNKNRGTLLCTPKSGAALRCWCGKRDLNPYVNDTRPSNVPVCQFQHCRKYSSRLPDDFIIVT